MPFPNFTGKHAYDSMFGPQEFLEYKLQRDECPEFDPPEGIILSYGKGVLEHVLKNYQIQKAQWFTGELYLLDGGRIGVLGDFGIGSPAATIVLEELIAFGVKKFVSVGTAGSLQGKFEIGDTVVCERAIRDEGTSHHYAEPSKYAYASKEMTKSIKLALDEMGQRYTTGTSWTVDAAYRETVAEARHYQSEGVDTVEMEASALFTVAQYRCVELGAIFTISDSLAELSWQPKFHHAEKKWHILLEAAKKAIITLGV